MLTSVPNARAMCFAFIKPFLTFALLLFHICTLIFGIWNGCAAAAASKSVLLFLLFWLNVSGSISIRSLSLSPLFIRAIY